MSTSAKDLVAWIKAGRASEYSQLADYVRNKGWTGISSLSEAWRLIDDDSTLSHDDRKSLRDAAALAFVQLGAENTPSFWSKVPGAFGIGVFVFMFLVVIILAGAIFEAGPIFNDPVNGQGPQPLLVRLADASTARGLITFVFTIGVVALALIIVTANVTTEDGDGKRFERSKEILTALIVILGTIMGFYFGKTDTPAPQQTVPLVADSEAPLPEDPTGDGSGGVAPDAPSPAGASAPPD